MKLRTRPSIKICTVDILQYENRTDFVISVMKQYNIGWKLGFFNGRTTNARCNFLSSTLEISNKYISSADNKSFRNTILHEISHILCGWSEGHNSVWKSMFKNIGGNGKRLGGY